MECKFSRSRISFPGGAPQMNGSRLIKSPFIALSGSVTGAKTKGFTEFLGKSFWSKWSCFSNKTTESNTFPNSDS